MGMNCIHSAVGIGATLPLATIEFCWTEIPSTLSGFAIIVANGIVAANDARIRRFSIDCSNLLKLS